MNKKERHKERLELYNAGFNDRQIAKKVYVTPQAIWYWRKQNDLLSHNNRGSFLDKEEQKKRMELYHEGLSDKEMSNCLNISGSGVAGWRKRNDLPANNYDGKFLSKEKHKKRMNLYKKGLSDREMSKCLSITEQGVAYWRRKNNLSINNYNKG